MTKPPTEAAWESAQMAGKQQLTVGQRFSLVEYKRVSDMIESRIREGNTIGRYVFAATFVIIAGVSIKYDDLPPPLIVLGCFAPTILCAYGWQRIRGIGIQLRIMYGYLRKLERVLVDPEHAKLGYQQSHRRILHRFKRAEPRIGWTDVRHVWYAAGLFSVVWGAVLLSWFLIRTPAPAN